mmetsp:Transcript_47515/g.57548  ORF Transcript_47515/g.57548 Transcript_47515/m.57548 type:complete len:117 (-) Transcript_47515:326-676(-)
MDHKLNFRISKKLSPYTKITFSKIICFSNPKALHDYATRLSTFLALEAHRDVHHSLFVGIDVDGFKQKMLVTRYGNLSSSSSLFRESAFWFFTCLGFLQYLIACGFHAIVISWELL